MMKISSFNFPSNYILEVKTPGEAFLSTNAQPKRKEWLMHDYWRLMHNDLYSLYRGICVYSGIWTPRTKVSDRSDSTSVDHFVPKSHSPLLAYEWTNFRLCRARLNSNKGDSLEIIDPMLISGDWFVVDFDTFLITPNDGLSLQLENQIKRTIQILGLNHNDFVEQRLDIIKEYVLGNVTYSDVEDKFPFISHEMDRQDFDLIYKKSMYSYFYK